MYCARLVLLLLAISGFAQDYQAQFSGEISRSQAYRKDIASGLLFQLEPTGTGWMIKIVSKAPCVENGDWASVVTAPWRGYNSMYVDSSYGVTAKEAVEMSPREFSFVATCEDYKRESHRLEIVLWPYNYSRREVDDALARLGSSPLGQGKLTILDAKVSPAEESIEGKNYGKIDWLKFTLDIKLPAVRERNSPQTKRPQAVTPRRAVP